MNQDEKAAAARAILAEPFRPTDADRVRAVRMILYADGPETEWSPETLEQIARVIGETESE